MAITIKKQLAPQSAINQRTHGYGNPCKYITIHQTGNPNVGANAQAHANIQSKLNPRQASWHYSVDDKEIIQSFEDSVKCWHATDGKGPGNTTSIAIEICINSDGDYVKAVKNAAELTKYLMDKHGLSIDKIKQHHDWYPKDCPAQLRAGYKGITWSDFISMVKGVKPSMSKPKPAGKTIDQLVKETLAGKHGDGEARKKSLGKNYQAVQDIINGKSKPTSKPVSKPNSGKHGKLKIVGVKNAAIVMDSPDRNKAKNLGTVKLGSTLPLNGSVRGKNSDTGYWEVEFKGKLGYITGKFGKQV